jgi:hypothetical protein
MILDATRFWHAAGPLIARRTLRHQPRNRRRTDVVAAADVGKRFVAGVAAPDRRFWCGVSLGGRPILCPRATARARPSPVRARIRSRSNSASPPSTVSIKRPCDVVVSAHASPMGFETGFLGGDRRERVQQVAGGSREAVEPGHGEHVAGVEHVEQPAKLRAVGLRAARHCLDMPF